MAKKLSGWQKAGLVAGLGCLSIIVLVVVVAVGAVIWARATVANLGDTTPKPVDRRIALPVAVTAEADPSAAGGKSPTGRLRLTLDLREGTFTIRPGAPGSNVQVQGTYAPGLYELIENHDTDAARGARRTTIRFRSKAPAWARALASIGGGDFGDRPELTVLVPRGSPIDLALQVSMGESEIDLGGLTLGEVNLDVSMGEHRIDFQEPVVEGVRRLRLNASMGNVSVARLGNARAATIMTTGSMGNLMADLGGEWLPGTAADLTFEQSMGEITLRVPSDVRLESDVRRSPEAPEHAPVEKEPPADPDAPTLRLRVTTSMGGSRVIRY